MRTLTTTEDLKAFCNRAATCPYVTLDTEFLRDRTYYSRLCLVQMAIPGEGDDTGDDTAVLIDPLADGLSLSPLLDLFRNEAVVKVFHAARQDLEIFQIDYGVLPAPLFDTQVAAMVCGFGDQAGYETLVRRIARETLDKTSRFTDWSRRPLSRAQQSYALADVTHLRTIYEFLDGRLAETGRRPWVQEELAVLTDPGTYTLDPEQAWRRIRTRSTSAGFMAAVYTLARFREIFAQTRNIPRSRVLKDEALLELASTRPKSQEDLVRNRLLLREARKGAIAEGILQALAEARELPEERVPRPDTGKGNQQVNPAIANMLRVLLKAKSEETGVAQKLITSVAELDTLAAGGRDGLRILQGWRAEVFGNDALRLCNGEIGLRVDGQKIRPFEL